ncbi:MAG TPA: PH domain-containing protein [Demequina sp.]|nr:PH domain-containing protein [Demequina sp.]
MRPTVVYRTAVSTVLARVSVVLAVLAIAYFAVTGGVPEVIRSGGVAGLFATSMWVSFALPHVTVSDGGVTVRNVLRTTHVPWPIFTGVDSRWALTIHTTEGDVGSWAIPAASGFAARSSRDVAGQAERGVNANTVALAIGARHRELRDAGYLGRRTVQRVLTERTWNRGAITAVAVALAVAATWALLG